jgi:hypothetical protein
MARGSESESSARGAALRASKDRLLSLVSTLAEARDLRALAGGGVVFPLHGLISPRVSRTVAFVVAPVDLAPLVAELGTHGWAIEPSHRFLSPLPTAILRLTHEEWPCALNLHSVIPGFFADPEDVFEQLWTHRTTVELLGTRVPVFDKISTVIFAAHDRLMGDRSRPSPDSNLEFFIDQFRRALSPRECRELQQRVAAVGGAGELSPLLEGLGLDPGDLVLPSDEYTRWRLGLDRVTMADCCLLGVFELPAKQRWSVIRHKVRWTLPGVLRASRAAVVSFARLRRAPQRLASRLR